jgi:transposase-like protein
MNVKSPTSSSESTIAGDCTYLKIGGCLVPYAETGECFAMVVPDRTKNTLWPLKASRTAAWSTVYTDSDAVYDGITGPG